MSYDRYKKFRINGTIKHVPFISIPIRDTDLYVNWNPLAMRLDLLSYQYYNDPNYGWLILQANPGYGGLEFRIPSGAQLRIPYPLEIAITQYSSDISEYDQLYGIE